MADSKSIKIKLAVIQHCLKAPKGQYNSFGKYNYRSAEDILEAVKPIIHQQDTVLTLTDMPMVIGDRVYIEATATLRNLDNDETIETKAYAREPESKTGMDASQITGTASSYARKYALNGLFCIDDTKDADTDEYQKQTKKTEPTKAEPKAEPQKPQTRDVDEKTKAEAELIVKKFEGLSSEGFIKPSSLANMKMAYGKLKTEPDYLMFIANCKKNIQDAEKAKAESFNDDKIPF